MSLRKLHKIVKDREACFVAEHVIRKGKTWLSIWTIPMRTQGPVKPLALVEVEKYLGGRGSFPSSGTILESKARSTRFWMCYQILYSKKHKAISCRSGSFDWVCSLDFTDGCGRDLEWAKFAKTRWPAPQGQAYGKHSALGGKWFQRKSVPSRVYMPMYQIAADHFNIVLR